MELSKVGIGEVDALIDFKLAPLASRRDIAMLGAIHRAVLGEGPPQLRAFFTLDSSNLRRSSRYNPHGKQLECNFGSKPLDTLKRYILGLCRKHSMFPVRSSIARVCDRSKARWSSFCVRKPSLRCRIGRSCCRLDGRFSNIHSGQLGSALIMVAEPPCVPSVHYPSRIA